MSKRVKMWLFAATALVVLGLILFAGVMVVYDWNFIKLSTVTYVTNTYEVSGTFDKISIDADTADIVFVPTDDGSCSIVCFEEEKVKHFAVVQNETLVIDTIDTRNWYDHIHISLGTPKMTVYLPEKEYASLFIETDTGDIKIDNLTAGQLNLTTTTGEIKVHSVTIKNDIGIETDTGEVKLTDSSCADFTAESDTGMIALKNVAVTDSLSIESDTGDVRFEDSDAAQIFVKTSTGDVTGTLLSEKVFITETSTGRISVPKTTSGGRCEIKTSTGDIKIEIN